MKVKVALFAVIVVIWAVLRWRRRRQRSDTVDPVFYYRQMAESDDPAVRALPSAWSGSRGRA